MTERTMRGLLRSALACVPLLTLIPSLAGAQTTTTTPTQTQSASAIDSSLVVKRNGTQVENGSAVYANIADCGGDPDFRYDGSGNKVPTLGNIFSFSTQYSSLAPVIELWVGVSGTDCTQPASRINQGGTSQLPPLCMLLGRVTSNSRPLITVNGRRLFQRQPTAESGADPENPLAYHCDPIRGSPLYIAYLLPLDVATTATSAAAVKQIGVIGALKASFTLYSQRPDAPTDVTGVNGENRLELRFKAPTSAASLTRYRAYFDTVPGSGGTVLPEIDAGSTGDMDAAVSDAGQNDSGDAGSTAPIVEDAGAPSVKDSGVSDAAVADAGAKDAGIVIERAMCGSGTLTALRPAPEVLTGIVRTSPSNSKSAALTDLSAVQLHQVVAAAAVSIDPAGNESPLSGPTLVCLTRTPTTGFLDACDNAHEGTCGLNSCSFHPTREGSAIGAAVLMLAVAALLRRRGRA